MFRIAFAKMLVLLRLAIVASLALYTLPNATFAMHGDEASSVAVSLDNIQDEHASMDDSDHHDHGITKDTAKHDQKQDKQNCCSDFCISLAIISDAPDFGSPRSDSVRDFLNDSSVFGQLQSLHRPPSIRA
ncbi:hypothetical protein IHQ71_16550 [Rhizobium sp. TH2]|uniref:hypothetical protein n=1 Tax=Rhizobium sp. TH2 TaxID=2775403 RepID=UPI0021579479|nr:hypothetical protein [Rhizobium sp. TH2]UVC06859.1 hypothetical protein IHQ71_16550 [Rhizobium sp. TH2]